MMTVKMVSYLNLVAFRVDSLLIINYEPIILSVNGQIKILHHQFFPDSVTLQSNHLYKADETLYEMIVCILDGYNKAE